MAGQPAVRTEFGGKEGADGGGPGAMMSRAVSPSHSPFTSRAYSLQREAHQAFFAGAVARAARFEAAIKAVQAGEGGGAGGPYIFRESATYKKW